MRIVRQFALSLRLAQEEVPIRSVAVVTFEGFNEIDSFVSFNILNRVPGCRAEITCPTESVRSRNGVRIERQQPLEFIPRADAVIFGSGALTAQIVQDEGIISRLKIDPRRQLVVSQCSGALVLARLGLLASRPVSTDSTTRPLIEAQGICALEQPFFADGSVGSAGGCLSSPYLAAWIICSLFGEQAARDALDYVAPVGREQAYIDDAISVVAPYVELSVR